MRKARQRDILAGMIPFRRISLHRVPGVAALFLLFVVPPTLATNAPSLDARDTATVLATIKAGAGALPSLRGTVTHEKAVPEADAVIRVQGRITVIPPGTVCFETFSPVEAGFFLRNGTIGGWSRTGGGDGREIARSSGGAGAAARFIAACLIFDEDALRRFCEVEVLAAHPPTVRLTPVNASLRKLFDAAVVIYAEDGAAPRSFSLAMPRAGDSVFLFTAEDSPPPAPSSGPGRLYSAVLRDGNGRLPLLLYTWEKEGKTRCAVYTEMLVRLGTVETGTPDPVTVPSVPDDRAADLLAKIGAAIADGGLRSGCRGDGWRLDVFPVTGEQ